MHTSKRKDTKTQIKHKAKPRFDELPRIYDVWPRNESVPLLLDPVDPDR